MKKIFIIIFTLFLVGCKPVHTVIEHHEYITHTIDSTVLHDSTVLVPVEVYTNLAWNYDTLHLSTSLADAYAWVDSCFLVGTMKNKDKAQFKYVYVDKWHVRDSVVYEKVPDPYPVEVMVEKPLNNHLLIWSIISSIGCLALLVWVFRKPIMKLLSHI